MKIRKFKTTKNYLLRIISFLLGFMILVTIPFSWLLQGRAREHVTNSIQDANRLFLQQMNSDYSLFKENMTSLCFTVSHRHDAQMLLYMREMDYGEIHEAINAVNSDIVVAQPSIYSIEFYNSRRGEWYSTLNGSICDGSEIELWLQKVGTVPKLQPQLRKIQMNEWKDAYTYVFSYFMYEYQAPGTMEGSFIVINQRADWFVEALTRAGRSIYDTKAFMADASGEIYNYDSANMSEEDIFLVSECLEKLRNGTLEPGQGSYVSNALQEQYLLSYLTMEEQGGAVVLVQNYDEVFGSLKKLRNEFTLLVSIFALAGIGIVFLLSRNLYKPVNQLITYAQELEKNNLPLEETDEFARIQNILSSSASRNQSLQEQKTMRDNVLRRLMLANLMQDASEENWKRYQEFLPDAPLCRQNRWRLSLVVVTIDSLEENSFGFLESEEELVLYAVYNIFSELLEDGMVERIKQRERELICIVNWPELPENTLENRLKQLQKLVEEKLDVQLTMACSGTADSVHALPELYQQARTCLKYRKVYGSRPILTPTLCERNEVCETRTYSEAAEKRLLEYLRIPLTDKVLEVLEVIEGEIRQLRCEDVMVNVIELMSKIKTCFNELGQLEWKVDFSLVYDRVLAEESLDACFRELKEQLVRVLERQEIQQTEALERKEKRLVGQVMEYVEQNYADRNLSMQTIADNLDTTSRFLSKKFRQHTDMSVNEYILAFRLKRAAELLINTDMQVAQVAECIGIDNDSYFYHLFKKQFGCTPREFAQARRTAKK